MSFTASTNNPIQQTLLSTEALVVIKSRLICNISKTRIILVHEKEGYE